MKVKPFMVVVMDAEGVTNNYIFKARNRRHAERDARECVAQSDRGTTLVGVTPMVDYTRRAGRRRLLAVATFAVSGTTIAAMIIGLSLEGAI